jgi:hypothetical protein
MRVAVSQGRQETSLFLFGVRGPCFFVVLKGREEGFRSFRYLDNRLTPVHLEMSV